MKVHTNPDHYAITTFLDADAGVDDPGHHHQKHYNSPRHGGTQRSKSPGKAYDYEYDKKRWVMRGE
jgi:hypothetical protein